MIRLDEIGVLLVLESCLSEIYERGTSDLLSRFQFTRLIDGAAVSYDLARDRVIVFALLEVIQDVGIRFVKAMDDVAFLYLCFTVLASLSKPGVRRNAE